MKIILINNKASAHTAPSITKIKENTILLAARFSSFATGAMVTYISDNSLTIYLKSVNTPICSLLAKSVELHLTSKTVISTSEEIFAKTRRE